MRVILKGNPAPSLVAQVVCTNCNSVIEVDKKECEEHSSYQGTFYRTKEKCPVCSKLHFTLYLPDFKPKAN